MSDVFYREYLAACAERDQLRAELAAERERAMFGNVSGVTAAMKAFHTDPHMDEGTHEHTWVVTAFYPSDPFRDGRAVKSQLTTILANLPCEDGLLPDSLWSQEDIAKTLLRLMSGNIVGIRITRSEGFETWVWRK